MLLCIDRIVLTAEELLESSLDEMQAKLDAVGIVPVAGDAADAVNSVIYAVRGKKKDALISGISMISLSEMYQK